MRSYLNIDVIFYRIQSCSRKSNATTTYGRIQKYQVIVFAYAKFNDPLGECDRILGQTRCSEVIMFTYIIKRFPE